MIIEMRKKSQITIPKDIVQKLGLKDGDKFEVVEHEGAVMLIPVAVYPQHYVNKLESELADLKQQVLEGKHPVFDNVESMLEDLDN